MSHLLANIALNGKEEAVRKSRIYLTRYADAFLILFNEYKTLAETKFEIGIVLQNLGLKLTESKTKKNTLGV